MQGYGEQFHGCYDEPLFYCVTYMGSFDIHGFVVTGQGKHPTNVYTFLTFNSMHV